MKKQIFMTLLVLFCVIYSEYLWNILRTLQVILTEAKLYQSQLVDDTTEFLQQYDFIIVGGGTAGCIIANRLSENPRHSVLLLEAGGDENYLLTIPAIAPFFYRSYLNWGHRSTKQETSCLGFDDGRCHLYRGKVLGGTSVINAMLFNRGNRKDYDRWLELGNYGWGYEDVLPYFKKFEDLQIPEYLSEYRGTRGPVPINFSPYITQLGSSFFKSLKNEGYENVDYNTGNQTGYSKIQISAKNSSRYSMNRAYLMPIKYRKNLHVAKNAFVTKLIINPVTKTTVGVEFIKNNKKYQIQVKKEVILSAGVFGTPQILMLSGIGPEEHLNELKIPLIKNLKVGYNYQDHVGYLGFFFLIDEPISLSFKRFIFNLPNELIDYFFNRNGALAASFATEAISFINSKYNNDSSYPDLELVFLNTAITQDPYGYKIQGIRDEVYMNACQGVYNYSAFTILPILQRPKSVGRLTLKSSNPYDLPDILTNYLKEEEDIKVLIQGIRIAIKIAESDEFKKFGTRVHKIKLPECDFEYNSDEYWTCMIRHLTLVGNHIVGTAKMGPKSDPDAVVDPELRVYGVKGLRVIDASVMPFIPTAHVAASVMMIAEKGADFIIKSLVDYKCKKQVSNCTLL